MRLLFVALWSSERIKNTSCRQKPAYNESEFQHSTSSATVEPCSRQLLKRPDLTLSELEHDLKRATLRAAKHGARSRPRQSAADELHTKIDCSRHPARRAGEARGGGGTRHQSAVRVLGEATLATAGAAARIRAEMAARCSETSRFVQSRPHWTAQAQVDARLPSL
jgi:hypothetical protein